LNREQGGCKEWIFGVAELPADGKLPLHTHRNDITIYILSGNANVRLGARAVELEPFSGAYFFARKPHSIESRGPEPLRYLYTYVCVETPQTIDWELADEQAASGVIIENKPDTRWAVNEELCYFWHQNHARLDAGGRRVHGSSSELVTIPIFGGCAYGIAEPIEGRLRTGAV
jgi:mannose-6-phosphate isomerase-like protein (cupin superfamily)